MSAKRAAAIGHLLVLVIVLSTTTAQAYQPDDPVPPGAVFKILDLQYRIVDLQFRVEAAPDAVAGGAPGTKAPGPGEIREARPIRPGITSGPHSTMSSDFLYLPANPDAVATLTIRVADGQGQPLQGKRVEVASAVSGGPADTIIQPEAPTDA